MNGAAIPASGVTLPATAPNVNGGFNNVSGVNSQRIAIVAERLAMCAQPNNPTDATCFFNLCISLSRGIDFAIATNQIPTQASNLPKICKLVCHRRRDCNLQAPIMVLMVTMKHACNAQWFSSEETQELLALAEEVERIFNTPEGIGFGQANINSTVSQIMYRYYPRIKLEHILVSVDIKPGFEACAVDFHITKNMKFSTSERKIRLLVAIKDNIDTSSCIITPQKVNIMLNGKGVLGRMVGHTELGPQLPTMVTYMLRYGTNLLQAIGSFDAHYIVLIAFMSDVPSSFLPVPEDYAQPASVTVESDPEVVEGPSRISLNCPISFTRIKKPAKGKLCKHLQCFDLSNYVDMNTQCPSWRCPHCNQSVCYPDIRIDRKMSKILQEVAESVVSVTIHSDGSWEAISGSNDHKDESNAKPTGVLQEGSNQPPASELPNEPCDIYDLTEEDVEMVDIDVDMPEDTKPMIQSDLLNTSTYMTHLAPSVAVNPSDINRNSATQVQGFPCPGPSATMPSPADYNPRTDIAPIGGISAPMLRHFTPSAVLTDSVSPAVRQTQQAFMGTNQQSSPSVPSATNALQLHQQMVSSGYGGHAIQRNVTRVPNSIQALPVQMPGPSPMMSTRPSMNNVSGNTTSLPSRNSLPPTVAISASAATRRDSVQQYHILDSQLEQQSTAQLRGLRAPVQVNNNAFRAASSPQATTQQRPTTPVQAPNINPFRPNSSPQATNQQRPMTQMPPPMVSTPPHLRGRPQAPPGGLISNINRTPTNSHLRPMQAEMQAASVAAQLAARTRQLHTTPGQTQPCRAHPASASRPVDGPRNVLADGGPSGSVPAGRTVQTVSRTQDLVGVQSEQNWHPTARMRGSLDTDRAFSENLHQFIIRPTQQTTTAPPVQSPALQALLANRSLHASSQPNPSQEENNNNNNNS